jgi:hypothetical protein
VGSNLILVAGFDFSRIRPASQALVTETDCQAPSSPRLTRIFRRDNSIVEVGVPKAKR